MGALALLTLLAAAAPAAPTSAQIWSEYIGRTCRGLHDPPIAGRALIGPSTIYMGRDFGLILTCGRHAYRPQWVPVKERWANG
jgi:hypothetical protein